MPQVFQLAHNPRYSPVSSIYRPASQDVNALTKDGMVGRLDRVSWGISYTLGGGLSTMVVSRLPSPTAALLALTPRTKCVALVTA